LYSNKTRLAIYRKPFLSLALFFFCISSGFAQIVEKGNASLEAYFGAPDIYKIVFRSALGNSVYNVNTRAQGPFGARFDYMLSKRIGIGADIWYVNTTINGIYNPTNTTTAAANNIYFDGKLMRINLVPRLTIHLSKHDKFDPYFHAGVGFLYSRFQFSSTNKSAYNEKNPLGPIAFRVGMGLKYYFTPELGAVIDAGLGGPLISIGFFKCWRKDEDTY